MEERLQYERKIISQEHGPCYSHPTSASRLMPASLQLSPSPSTEWPGELLFFKSHLLREALHRRPIPRGPERLVSCLSTLLARALAMCLTPLLARLLCLSLSPLISILSPRVERLCPPLLSSPLTFHLVSPLQRLEKTRAACYACNNWLPSSRPWLLAFLNPQ